MFLKQKMYIMDISNFKYVDGIQNSYRVAEATEAKLYALYLFTVILFCRS